MSKTFDRTSIKYYKKRTVNVMENRIRLLREQKMLSQAQLAEQCNVTRQTINAIENDKYDPTLELAFKLSKVLNTTVDELFLYGREK
jgi:putative transcriptional regulator